MKKFAIILAGGSGTRFWPKSSRRKPKQLLALIGKDSLLQQTNRRLKPLITRDETLVVATDALRPLISKQLPNVAQISEPLGRNTMAAVCLGVWTLAKKYPQALAAVLPADAFIKDEKAYRQRLNEAFILADQGKIVCLGIQPTYAATGYGYIKAGEPLTTDRSFGAKAFSIDRFVEKPSSQIAEEMVSSRDHFWNAGIFVFKIKTFIEETRLHAPEYALAFDQIVKKPTAIKRYYAKLPRLPLDIALMEKTARGAVLETTFGWSDLGSWTALSEVMSPNSDAGLVRAASGCISLESEGLTVDVSPGKFVGLIGLKDLIIVETESALLICAKEKAQEIKTLVAQIEKNRKLARKLL